MNNLIFEFILSNYDILIIIIFCFIGAILKDIYNTLTDKDYKVNLTRIFVSGITASILSYSFRDVFMNFGVNDKLMISLYFISGMAGFNFLEKLSTIEGIGEFLNYLKDYFIKK